MTDFALIPVTAAEEAECAATDCPACWGTGRGNPLPVPRNGPGLCSMCGGTGRKRLPRADITPPPSAADCCASPHTPAPHPSRHGLPGGAGFPSDEAA